MNSIKNAMKQLTISEDNFNLYFLKYDNNKDFIDKLHNIK
jgi:hypothetical protein